jgi:putative membrane protein
MVRFIIRFLISAFGLWVASLFVHGLDITGRPIAGVPLSGKMVTLLETAAVLGLANAIVRPILVILTFPITILTLGLFLIVVNAGIILLVGHVIHGFQVHGWGPAIWTAIVTGVISWLGHGLTHEDDQRARSS